MKTYTFDIDEFVGNFFQYDGDVFGNKRFELVAYTTEDELRKWFESKRVITLREFKEDLMKEVEKLERLMKGGQNEKI